jgi:hypothetical protein
MKGLIFWLFVCVALATQAELEDEECNRAVSRATRSALLQKVLLEAEGQQYKLPESCPWRPELGPHTFPSNYFDSSCFFLIRHVSSPRAA